MAKPKTCPHGHRLLVAPLDELDFNFTGGCACKGCPFEAPWVEATIKALSKNPTPKK